MGPRNRHWSRKNIACISAPFPIWIKCNLAPLLNDLRNRRDAHHLRPVQRPVVEHSANTILPKAHRSKAAPGDSASDPFEKVSDLFRWFLGAVVHLASSQFCHRLHIPDGINASSQGPCKPFPGFQCGASFPNRDRRPLRGGVLRARGHRLRDLRALRLPVPGGQGGGGFHLSPRLGLRRPACRGVDPSRGADLSAAQDAAHHGAARELLCGGGGVEDGPLVRGGEQGIARPVHGVLQGTLDHALHHFLLALVHHGLHPGLPGALPASQLVRQGLDAASDFHGGVHQAVSNGVQRRLCPHGVLVLRRLVGFADQRRGHFLLRLQLDHVVQSVLVAAAHHLGKGGPVLGVFRHGADGPLYRRRHAGADGLRRCTGQPRRGLRGRAPAAGQQGKDRLGQGGHCAGAQVLKDLGGLSAPRRVGRVMRFNGLLLLPDVRRPSVEKSLVGKGAQVISAQQFKGRKRDILSQREGVSAKPRHLLQTLDHRAFHGLSERIRPLDLPAVFRPPSLPAGVRDSVQILFQRLSRCVRGPGLLAVQAEFPPDFLQCFPLQALRREPGSGSASLLDGVQADQCLPDGVRPAFIGLRPFCAGGSGQGRGGHPALWLCPRRRG